MIHSIWKHYGETMTDVLERCRTRDRIAGPATYAGRLDPAAQGIVHILSGNDRFQKDSHLAHDKEYTVDVLCGIETDTDDIFGIITKLQHTTEISTNFESICQRLIGTSQNPIHQYSGYRHRGKPLWSHTRNNQTPTIMSTTTVKSLNITNTSTISSNDIRHEVSLLCNTPALSGFRTSEIQESWEQLLPPQFPTISLVLVVSTGTYIRTLVHNLGSLLGIPTCAYHITRTRIIDQL